MRPTSDAPLERAVTIPAGGVTLHADLTIPPNPRGIVLFAHGSGSSRLSPRNRAVAAELQQAHFATLLLDLLTVEEERVDVMTRELRFDIPLLAARLVASTVWVRQHPDVRTLPVGYFGASTGAAAALVAAARLGDVVHAIVSRGGRPDMAGHSLAEVHAPTLLIVGGYDEPVVDLNRDARARMHGVTALKIVPRAGHLFEEPGAMAQVTELARAWFDQHLVQQGAAIGGPGAGW
jgi:pimeloyl-ACP methyl ester carboxylesterase